MKYKQSGTEGFRNDLALRRAKMAAKAAARGAGGVICIVIVCNESGSSIAVDGTRKISTEELISKMTAQVEELRARLGKPTIIVPS
jgi:hypothetical protein